MRRKQFSRPFRLGPFDPALKSEDKPVNAQDQSSIGTSQTGKMTSTPKTSSTRSLTSLPPEIILRLLEESRPDGFQNLTLTSKTVYNLAGSRLIQEHNAFKHRYSTCLVDGRDPDPDPENPNFDLENPNFTNLFIHPVYLLQEIQANPTVAGYVKYLELEDCGECNQGDVKDKAKQLDLTFLENSFYLKKAKQGSKKWADAVSEGNEIYGKILLLMLLPNVETLRLYDTWAWKHKNSSNDGADRVLDAIATDDRPQRVLSRLIQIVPWSSDDEFGSSLDTVRPFMALPSMRRLIGFQLVAESGGISNGAYAWPFGEQASPVKAVECTSGAVDREHLEVFLAPMKSLQSFKWDHGCFGEGTGYFFNGGAFFNCLKSHVSKTLTQLTLTCWGHSLTAIDSFRAFERLEYLEFEVKLLYGERDEGESDEKVLDRLDWFSWKMDYGKFTPPKLIDILPASLRRTRLINNLEQDKLIPLFDSFVEGKSTHLPALSKIEIASKVSFSEELLEQMRETGIEVERSDSTQASHYITL